MQQQSTKSPSIDPLDTLQRAIATAVSAPAYAQPSLGSRLWRMTAPVLEEREHLLAFLDRGWQWLDAHPDAPDHDARVTRWIDKLQRYEQIERVLATFPTTLGSVPALEPDATALSKPRTKRSTADLAQPP